MQEQLFNTISVKKSDDACSPAPVSHQVIGRVSELRAEVELLLRGHKVAHPGTDDDGVDLIVDYGIAVQVKATGSSTGGKWSVNLNGLRFSERRAGESVKGCLREHVDVLIVHAHPISAWWVIPRSALDAVNAYSSSSLVVAEIAAAARGNTAFISHYRDRWDVFDYPDNFGIK
jgi:hypothetical protein